MNQYDALIKGALLHDIGKILYRADHSVGNHSAAGVTFLKQYLDTTEESRQILHCVNYHHGSRLSSSSVANDDWAYIVYEADNIASGIDRRSLEGDDAGFDAQLPLKSVFTAFGGAVSADSSQYVLRGLDASGAFNYPTKGDIKASPDQYKKIVETLRYNFSQATINQLNCDEILRFYEDTTAYIPSSTNKSELADISLYMHSKITAAVAVCMAHYFDEQGISDYKTECLSKVADFRKKEAFLLVSGDFSGIQNFIYTIPSKGALKSLRGRSFYLEILLEHLIDEVLAEVGVSRVNVLYVGGGHFYLLLPNTQQAKECIERMSHAINQWLLTHIGNSVYLAMGAATCTAEDLRTSSEQRNCFVRVSEAVAHEKSNRYSKSVLKDLFSGTSEYNQVKTGSRECLICHTSTAELQPYGDDDEREACPVCSGLFQLGSDLAKLSDSCFVVAKPTDEGADSGLHRMPVYGDGVYLYVVSEAALTKNFTQDHEIIRIYGRNKAVTGELVSQRVWLADYVTKNHYNQVLDFTELSALSGEDGKGINRLGVLRADVDNLGAAFISGFIGDAGNDPFKYATFTRYADLSRDLSLFFKVAVNKLAAGEMNSADGSKREAFSFWQKKEGGKRNVHIIYSGGDDVFIVGAWNELLELAVDIRKALDRFTGGKITLSGGLALFTPKYPISKMTELTGQLESAAKGNPEKDSLALFGFETNANGEELQCNHIHKWQDFITGVCDEKVALFRDLLDIGGKPKLPIGKSMLYKFMLLIEDIQRQATKEEGKLNIARLLYTLARLQPQRRGSQEEYDAVMNIYNTFTKKLHEWVRVEKDRKELLTAIHLIIYYLRDTDKKA